MMTLQLSACSFKCQNKPQDHSYKVPLLPLLLPAAARCLIFFSASHSHACPPGHAPPVGGMASFATASGEASAVPHFFFCVSLPCMTPPQGEGGSSAAATYNGL